MYVDKATIKRNGKTYSRHLLRTSYRENGKVKHKTIANLGKCTEVEIQAIQLALRYKNDLSIMKNIKDLELGQGLSFGAIWLLDQLSERLGIKKALGKDRRAKLALWQVLARVLSGGSRLSAVRLADRTAALEILGLESFSEKDLYKNLDWICKNKMKIEQCLFANRKVNDIFLYDVTSSYLEGSQNELAAYGYSRDGKKSKQQIIVGLLCDEDGMPISIEVFPGNIKDFDTLLLQIEKVAKNFGAKRITFVGDRGMIKAKQIEELHRQEFHYITAITKPQIEKMLREGDIELTLFDEDIAEKDVEGIRYIFRKNSVRANEISNSRKSKEKCFLKFIETKNRYLLEHPRAKLDVALEKSQELLNKLKLSWISISSEERRIIIKRNKQTLEELSKLDGCYVLKTDLQKVDKEIIYERYKDLAKVEFAFRTVKTAHLEIRPLYLRKEERTRAHALVVMLAFLLVKELRELWRSLDLTVEEGIQELQTLSSILVQDKKTGFYWHALPNPRGISKTLLRLAKITMLPALPKKRGDVTTKTKLQKRRI